MVYCLVMMKAIMMGQVMVDCLAMMMVHAKACVMADKSLQDDGNEMKIGRAPKDHDGIASDGVIEVLLEVCVVFVGEGGEDVVDGVEGCGKQSIGEEVAVETWGIVDDGGQG